VLPHHSYSPDFSHADFLLFPEGKKHLANVTLTQDTLLEAPGNGPAEPSPLMISLPQKVTVTVQCSTADQKKTETVTLFSLPAPEKLKKVHRSCYFSFQKN
jgi:hypothetical protein